ncbi:MAG TPA: tail fiber domain-containing protein [Bacteroidales bacterium]|nr:tail fiber domain-containing protein [Bacteroidales bacterium]
MKTHVSLIIILIGVLVFQMSYSAWSQAPQSFKYQAVMRDKAGQVLPNQDISLRISILQSTMDGPEVYQEVHSVTTSELGLVNVEVGRGKALTGSLPSIDWSSGSHFLRIEMDPAGEMDFELMGVSQLLSVPYALYAEKSGSGSREADLDWEMIGNDVVTGHGGSYPTGNVGIGNNAPGTLLYVAKNMGEPTITIRNLGSGGGATYAMVDDLSGADWKFKATTYGGFKIRDHHSSLDVIVIEPGSAANAIYIKGGGNVGIGTGTPQFKLDVIADAQVNGVRVGRGGGNVLSNTGVGKIALNSNTTGYGNTAIGCDALKFNTTGYHNTASGSFALSHNKTGWLNTAVGYGALAFDTTGYRNTAVGDCALYLNTTGSENTASGAYTLYSNTTGNYNTAEGYSALLSNKTGHHNTACGKEALYSNTTGYHNIAIGYRALYSNTAGLQNVANGNEALYSNATGNNNTTSGCEAAYTNRSGHSITCIGYKTDVSDTALTNATALGNFATVNNSNKIRIGNGEITVIEGQVDWSFPSDGRFKQNVTEDVQGLAFIRQLRPVVYNFDTRKYTEFLMKNMPDSVRTERLSGQDFIASAAIRHSGFVAQEVVKAANDCGYDFSGVHVPVNINDNYSIAYGQFVVPLVKAVQEQQAMIEALQQKVAELEADRGR